MTHESAETLPAGRLRLADGYLLYPGRDGCWRIHGPDDTILRIQADPDLIAQVNDILSGRVSDLLEPNESSSLREILEQFVAQGVAKGQVDSPPLRPAVLVLGASVLAEHVARLLRDSSADVVREDAPGCTVSAAVACADWLPDPHWLELDARFMQSGIPWHMCYHEGGRFFAGPLAIPGRTPSYAECRARRLAASSHPEELLGLWAYLNANPGLPPPDHSPSVLSLIAGVMVTDVMRVLNGKEAVSAGFQLEIDPESLRIIRHPVLRLPQGLMLEAPA